MHWLEQSQNGTERARKVGETDELLRMHVNVVVLQTAGEWKLGSRRFFLRLDGFRVNIKRTALYIFCSDISTNFWGMQEKDGSITQQH